MKKKTKRKTLKDKLRGFSKEQLIEEIVRVSETNAQYIKLLQHQERIMVFHELLLGGCNHEDTTCDNSALHKDIEKLLKEQKEKDANISRNQ